MLRRKQVRKRGGQDLLDRFAIYLSRRREAHNLSIREMGHRAGLPHTNIFQFEKLRKNPRLTELALLAKAFGETIAKFVEPLQRDSSAVSAEEDTSGPSATSSSALGENSQII